MRRAPSFSAPFVSATAALLLERFPGISPAAVLRRLQATADPAPGGAKEYGKGLLNPYRALATAGRPPGHRSRRRSCIRSTRPRSRWPAPA